MFSSDAINLVVVVNDVHMCIWNDTVIICVFFIHIAPSVVINAGGIEKARNMSAPVVDYPSIRFNVNLNSSFNITCKTNSVNNSLTWHKDGSPEPLSLQQPDYTITRNGNESMLMFCLLYTSDAADE